MGYFKILILALIMLTTTNLEANIEIKYKIDGEIITNIDLLNEKNYLIFLRPSLAKLSEEEILTVSKNSLIREFIKKKEIERVFKNLNNEKYIEEIKKQIFKFKKVKNEDELLILIKDKDLNYDKIIKKMMYEGMWNELIYQKYNSAIKIDEDKLKKNLKIKRLNNIKFEYNLSELLFEIDESEEYQNKLKVIKEYIISNNFKIAASKYSIANSSSKGGEIGWVKETFLSKKLTSILANMTKGEMTEPIKYPSGYLILKINDKKEMKQVTNFDKELKELIQYEKNKQFNQFSLLFYKKLKQNTNIDEY